MARTWKAASRQAPRHAQGKTPATLCTALDRVALHNFGGHADLSLDMGKITVLTGPTGSGKSAIFRALAVLKSALEGGWPGPASAASRASRKHAGAAAGGSTDLNAGVEVAGRRMVDSGRSGEIGTRFSYRMSLDRSLSPAGMDAAVDVWCGPPPAAGPGTVRLEQSLSQGVGRERVLGARDLGGPAAPACAGGQPASVMRAELEEGRAAGALDDMFGGDWYFGSLLGGLRRVPLPWAAPSGRHGGCRPPTGKVSSLLREIGPGRIVAGIAAGDSGSRAKHGQDVRGVHGAGAGAGHDTGRPTAVLAALAHSPRGSVVAVEEPEIHLDPAAQVGLAKIMVRQAVEEDKQIVFTTHSDHLLYPLLAYVEKKGHPLGPGDVAIHHFGGGGQGAASGARRLCINEHGQVRGGLEGFWDVDMRAMGEIVREGAGSGSRAAGGCA